MREIKFRAWDNEENCWAVESFLIDPSGELCWNEACTVQPQDRFTLMQYTGLKDKNGKEIYEGDIIKTDSWVHYNNSVIEFEHGYFTPFQYDYINGEDLEVIGNIYENPELLDSENLQNIGPKSTT